MGTLAQQELENHVDSLLANSVWGKLLIDVKKNLRSRDYSDEAIDFVFQYPQKPIDIYDAYVYAQVHAAIFSGKISRVRIHVGTVPSRDSAVEDNNSKLSSLPYPFTADFFGGAGGPDGYLKWTDEITLKAGVAGYSDHRIQVHTKGSFPSQAQLEVGQQYASKTFSQLARYRCLARWPYGHKWIHLYMLNDNSLWSAGEALREILDELVGSNKNDWPTQLPLF